MAEKVVTQGKVLAKDDTKVQFGAVSSPTPQWAKWGFRGWAILTTVIVFVVAGSKLIPESAKGEINLWLKASDMLVLGLSNLFGIVPDEKK